MLRSLVGSEMCIRDRCWAWVWDWDWVTLGAGILIGVGPGAAEVGIETTRCHEALALERAASFAAWADGSFGSMSSDLSIPWVGGQPMDLLEWCRELGRGNGRVCCECDRSVSSTDQPPQ
eukprot:TRINITY_DN1073_c0_g1_i1.p1 TRINITY_DN1073_c0_g1~~TRINITY_DN1073_c0_g1_i1.p1  ORF type:complete len:135 (-),score=36.61 TRINITY_DN1073_c0_g1_i1:324-683(-)